MTFISKLRCAIALLESQQIKSRFYQPPIYRFFWALGAEIAPPHFASFKENWIFTGFITGFLWSVLMFISLCYIGASPIFILISLIPIGTAVGAVAGYMAARAFRTQSEQNKIPLWKDFHPND